MKKLMMLVAVVVVMCFVVSIEATLLTFTHEGIGNGTLDGISFSISDFVITAVGETNDRLSFRYGWWINHISASISIDGLGDFDFLTGTRTIVNNHSQTVVFSRERIPGATRGDDLFNGPSDALFSTWDMLEPIGPISGSGQLLQWAYFPLIDTSGGILKFDNFSSNATFTAVPEPCSLVLLSLGGLMLRRKR